VRELTRRRFLVSAGAAGAGLVLGACGSTKEPSVAALAAQGRLAASGGVRYDGPPVELQFWNGFTGGDGPFMRAFADSFNKAQDKVRVRMNVILWADFYQKTTAAVASGTGPDVGIMQLDQVPTAAAHRIIVPLDEVASALKLEESDFPAAVWRAGVIDGRRYGIPLDVHPLGMYVNESVLKDAGLDPRRDPATKAEYLADLAKLKAKGIAGAWVSPFLFTGSLQYQSLIAQFGGSLYDREARRATWNSDAGVEALSFMRDLVRKGYSIKNVGQDADAIAFKNGQNAFLWNGCWAINEYAGIPELKWHVAPVPQIGSQRAVWANSHQFVLFRQPHGDDNRLQAATSFIDYVSRRSQKWAEAGMVPARKTAREDPAFKKLKAQSTFARELPYVRFTPPVPGIDVVRALTLDPAIQSAVLLQEEPRAALEDAATRADALLADNRQKYGI
jgi:multiple sugar transport system substrate-binding protein